VGRFTLVKVFKEWSTGIFFVSLKFHFFGEKKAETEKEIEISFPVFCLERTNGREKEDK
jgi:hypothetical protein